MCSGRWPAACAAARACSTRRLASACTSTTGVAACDCAIFSSSASPNENTGMKCSISRAMPAAPSFVRADRIQLDHRLVRGQVAGHRDVAVVADHLPERMPGIDQEIGGVGGLLRQLFGRHRKQVRSEEHTSELQSLMRISYAVFCLKKKNKKTD